MPKNQYSSEEKLKIVIEALKEERLITDIASEYGVHHSVIQRWKKELLESAERVFAASKNTKDATLKKNSNSKKDRKSKGSNGSI
jgi:transposase-like protein